MCSRTPPDPLRPSTLGVVQLIRCPDCVGTGRVLVNSQTLLAASRPCGTCGRVALGCVQVGWLGSVIDGSSHAVITHTTRCLCRRQLWATDRTFVNGRWCANCLEILVLMPPTAAERAYWRTSLEP